MRVSQLYKCAACGHIIAESAVKCVGCGTPGPIARHPNNWRTVEPYEAIAPLLASERPSGFTQSVQSENRRPNYRRYLVISAGVIGAVLVLLIVIGIAVGPNSPGAPGASAPPVGTSNTPPSAESNTGPAAKSIGESFHLGNFEYKITGFQKTSYLGNEIIHKQADPGATYVIVSFEITNKSNSTETVLTDDFEIQAGGKTYRPDSDALTAYTMMDQNHDLILSELQPDVPRRSATIFLVSEDVLTGKVYLKVPEKGVFSSGEVLVALAP
jgi:hypothetical protein